MQTQALEELLSMVGDSLDLADQAVKAAESAAPRVEIVKVAADKCARAATALLRTGAFKNMTSEGIAGALSTASPAELVEIMEKLASNAIFPVDPSEDMGGFLVEKTADTVRRTAEGESKTQLWRRCMDEADAEISR
jgi:hypothetical protein